MSTPVAFSLSAPGGEDAGAASPAHHPPRALLYALLVVGLLVVLWVLLRSKGGGPPNGGPFPKCGAGGGCPKDLVCQCAGVDAGLCVRFPGDLPVEGYKWTGGWTAPPAEERAGCVADCAGRAQTASHPHWSYNSQGGSGPNCVHGPMDRGCAAKAPGWLSDPGAATGVCPAGRHCRCAGAPLGECVKAEDLGGVEGVAWKFESMSYPGESTRVGCAAECAKIAAGSSNWTYFGAGADVGPNCTYGTVRPEFLPKGRKGPCAMKSPGAVSDSSAAQARSCGRSCPLTYLTGANQGFQPCLGDVDCPGGAPCHFPECTADPGCWGRGGGKCSGGKCAVGVCGGGVCEAARDCEPYAGETVLTTDQDCTADPTLCGVYPDCRVSKATKRGFVCTENSAPPADGMAACVKGRCQALPSLSPQGCGGSPEAAVPASWEYGEMVAASLPPCAGKSPGSACEVRDAQGQLLWGGRCGRSCYADASREGRRLPTGCWPQTFCTAASGWTSPLNPRGVCADPEEALNICFQ